LSRILKVGAEHAERFRSPIKHRIFFIREEKLFVIFIQGMSHINEKEDQNS
jgi:hypothetical protein